MMRWKEKQRRSKGLCQIWLTNYFTLELTWRVGRRPSAFCYPCYIAWSLFASTFFCNLCFIGIRQIRLFCCSLFAWSGDSFEINMVKKPSNSKRGIETASTTLVEAATSENQPTFDSPATSLKSLLTSIHKDDPRWLSISRYIFDIAGGIHQLARR